MYRLIVSCCFICNLYGQNQHSRLWNADAFDSIKLELPFASSIVVSLSFDHNISLEYQTEGEYKNHLVLRSFQVGKTLQLVEQKGPSFNALHDKLSAHKVWASTLKLFLPNNFDLSLKAQNSHVDIQGNFHGLKLELYEGEIFLKGQKIIGEVKANKADIHLYGENHKAHAFSKYGQTHGPFSPADQSRLKLSSVEGNIFFISQRK